MNTGIQIISRRKKKGEKEDIQVCDLTKDKLERLKQYRKVDTLGTGGWERLMSELGRHYDFDKLSWLAGYLQAIDDVMESL